MNGAIFQQLEAYVTAHLSEDAWTDMLAAAGRQGRKYVAAEDYADEELVTLIGTLARLTWLPANEILDDFRGCLAPAHLEELESAVRPRAQPR